MNPTKNADFLYERLEPTSFVFFSPNCGNKFGATDFTVSGDQRKPLDECGGSNDAISWIFGIR